ncbi:MAG: DUF11 domain-containing protein [Tannerella sp.]|nr:DUF11 domain-containing protein [Tannerella sp.]
MLTKKDATLNGVQNNGTRPNPVTVLYSDTIEYKITVVNANLTSTGTLVIRDTLPAYLDYTGDGTKYSSHTPSSFASEGTAGVPPRDTLTWIFNNIPSLDTVTVTFGATPASGVSASQPMFVNRARITASDTPQALDYRTSPRPGILTVPDEGYEFAGWSHDSYVSLRGERIEPRTGIMQYDTLTVYGSVELRAAFAPFEYYANDLHTGRETVEPPTFTPEDKIWASGDELYVRTSKPGAIIRIYSPDGILHRLQTIVAAGETRIKLPYGIYIVTLNNGAGQKVMIEQ